MGQILSQEGLRTVRGKYFNSDSRTTVSQNKEQSNSSETVPLSLIEMGEPKLKVSDIEKLNLIPPLTYAMLSAAVYVASTADQSNCPSAAGKSQPTKNENPQSTKESEIDQYASSTSPSPEILKWRTGSAFSYSPNNETKNGKEGSQQLDPPGMGAAVCATPTSSSPSSESHDVPGEVASSPSVNPSRLPKGWTVFLHCNEVELERDGFCAIAYIRPEVKQCIIAFRGTANTLGLRAGIWMFFEELSIQFFLAKQFSKVVREKLILDFGMAGEEGTVCGITQVSEGSRSGAALESPWVEFPAGYQLSYTGHSLGAILASVRAVDEDVPAITFESPGCHALIQRFRKQKKEQESAKRMVEQWKKNEARRQNRLVQGLVASPAPSSISQPDVVQGKEIDEVPSLLSSPCHCNKEFQPFCAGPPPDSLLTNYLQSPNAINTLRQQIGYCVMLPVRGSTVEEEVLVASRNAMSLLAASDDRPREKKTNSKSRDAESCENTGIDEDNNTKNSSLRRFVPRFKVGMPTIPLPRQGILRSMLFTTIGMGDVMEILYRLEPHFKELMNRTRQQHSIRSIVEYFEAHQQEEEIRPGSSAAPIVSRRPTVHAHEGLQEVIAWPTNSLQYLEYLNTQRALQEPDVEGNWNVLKAYQSQLQHLFEVATIDESRGDIPTFRPLRQQYLSPSTVCLIDWWSCLTAEAKKALPLKAIDHAVLNTVHLTGFPSKIIQNASGTMVASDVGSISASKSNRERSASDEQESTERGLYVEDSILSPVEARDVLFRLSKQKHIFFLVQRELHRQSYQYASHL